MWITNTEAVPISNTVFNTIFGTGFVGYYFCSDPLDYFILHFRLYTFQQNTIWKTYSGNRWKSDGCSVFRNKSTENQDVCLYVIRSTFCFAGVLYADVCSQGRYSFGDGDEMSVIASVVLGEHLWQVEVVL